MPEQFGDKQHEATPHRREKAREEGQVARSQDLGAAAVLVGGIAVLFYLGEGLTHFLAEYTRQQLSEPNWDLLDGDVVAAEWFALAARVGRHLIPLLGLILVVSVAVHVGQSGWLWLPDKLALDFNRINPVSGAQRLFSLASLVRLAFGIFKVLIVGAVAYACLWGQHDDLLTTPELEIGQLSRFLVDISLWTSLKVGMALLVLSLLDYFYQWWKHEQDLRMTTEELREELKQMQGDPQVAARRKAVQRQLAQQRIRSAVPQADVVVTNPTELAIAIRYDPEQMQAPVVVAKGAGAVAQHIRRLALENGVPVVERKELARYLFKNVEIGKQIPAEQYAAMAEVLRYVYQLKGKSLPPLRRAA
ncbi:MAG: flagellar biosynthesis protein FlhB [Pirellulaceae bacterium]